MKQIVTHVLEMIVGAIIFTLSIVFLLSNERILNRLIVTVNASVVDYKNINQQYNNSNINLITSEELYAIVMGYREYPITIDGTAINMDGTEYENYIRLIKKGFYSKSYSYDKEQSICSVHYTYSGT